MYRQLLLLILLASASSANAALSEPKAASLSAQQMQQLRAKLSQAGASKLGIEARLASLTSAEQLQLLQQFKRLPAGAAGLEALVIVGTGLGALAMTDAMGFTDVIPFIKPAEKIEKLEPVEHY